MHALVVSKFQALHPTCLPLYALCTLETYAQSNDCMLTYTAVAGRLRWRVSWRLTSAPPPPLPPRPSAVLAVRA